MMHLGATHREVKFALLFKTHLTLVLIIALIIVSPLNVDINRWSSTCQRGYRRHPQREAQSRGWPPPRWPWWWWWWLCIFEEWHDICSMKDKSMIKGSESNYVCTGWESSSKVPCNCSQLSAATAAGEWKHWNQAEQQNKQQQSEREQQHQSKEASSSSSSSRRRIRGGGKHRTSSSQKVPRPTPWLS